MATVVATAIAGLFGLIEPVIVFFAFVAGVFVDFDHFLHLPTLKRILGGSRETKEQCEKLSLLHSVIGLVLFAGVSAVLFHLGKVGWWLPIMAFITHAALDSLPSKWAAGRDRYPFSIWLKRPVKWYLTKQQEDGVSEIKVSLAVSIGGAWILFALMLGFHPYHPLIVSAGCGQVAAIFYLHSLFRRLPSAKYVYILDMLLALGWLYFFVR